MSFFNELKRRNVFKVGIAYAVGTWVLIQIADILLDSFGAPPWVMKSLVLVLAVGFFVALSFAWAFELTPEGVKRESEVDRSQSITPQTGKKLNTTILVLMTLAIGYLLYDKFSAPAQPGSDHFSQQTANQSADAGEKNALTPVEAIAQAGNEAEPAINRPSIAVLPFANRSNQEDDLFFTDGIHDDLLTQLAKINDLKVISRTSVMEYRDTTKKIPEIAAELGVSTILEGGIQRAGTRIRINAQLIDVNTDEHLWAETFDREMTVENIFDIQSEITRQIVNAVRGELSSEETEVLAQLPTRNLEAYEAYLHAKSIFLAPDYTPQKFRDAEPWLEKAVELDPEFALVWAMLVRTYAQAIWQAYDDSPERLQQVRNALSKASEFGPFLPETLAARAEYLYRIENNFHEAEVAFRAASKANPRDANLVKLLAYTLRRTGKWEQSVSSFQLAFELEPGDISARSAMIETLITMGEFDRAEPLIDAWMERYPQATDIKGYKTRLLILRDGDLVTARNLFDQIKPNGGNPWFFNAVSLPLFERDYQAAIDIYDNPQLLDLYNSPMYEALRQQNKSFAHKLLGNARQSEEFAQKAIEIIFRLQATSSGSNEAGLLFLLANGYAQTDELVKAMDAINQACALIPESRDSFVGPIYSKSRALILAMSGKRDEALLEIERLLSTPSGFKRWNLYLNPQWDFFRDDERFNELIRPHNPEDAAF